MQERGSLTIIKAMMQLIRPRGKSRVTSVEADEYYKRDKLGSGSSWYSHEHGSEEACTTSPRNMKGTNDIASRLKGESEDWFHHDTDKDHANPTPPIKATSPLAKELIERAQGVEIKQVFQMEENLRTTWIAPSDPGVSEQSNGH